MEHPICISQSSSSLNSSQQHPHSDSEEVTVKFRRNKKKDLSNLVRFRNSKLGQSAPSLSVSVKDVRPIQRKTSRAQQRKSFISNASPTFPRCHSPMPASPIDSPKVPHSNRHFPFIPIRRPFTHLSPDCKDGRRWSVASLPSSGYDTNSGSSNVSSQCSSQERLHHLPNLPTSDELQILTEHFSSNECSRSTDDDGVGGSNGSGGGSRTSFVRPRSRSLSSPNRSTCPDNDIVTMNVLYKERFPNAMRQMEQRLTRFIEDDQIVLVNNLQNSSPDSAPIIRFVHHQIMEIARDCLKTSQEKLITRSYFYEISENLEKLLIETKEKSPEGAMVLSSVIKKLLLIISRPARLLECLEFDPEEFYQFLEEAEGQAKGSQSIADIPQYIINKLGINKDPIKELEATVDESEMNKKEENNQETITTMENNCSSAIEESFVSKKVPCEEDFEIVKLISHGAYGSVYLVRHRETRQRFALKKILKHSMLLRNQIEQVFAERDIMSFADNPFVVSMYCSFETKKHLCLVMEYVEGGDCASLLKTIGALPPDIAKFYFAETVLAVEYLHSYGIVHRDLKPDNLLITAFGHIKLTDFGLSKMGLMSLATHLYEVYIDKDTKQFSDKQVYGTPEYIAPEVILRQGYGKPVDWWSMGIILYEFLIGCVPFFGETPEELFAHTVNDDIEWPDEKDWPIQPEARDLITALLQQNPRDRLGTGGAHEVKEHRYFDNLDWDSLLRQKAEFVPQLSGEDDTSYFDSRSDRYKHEIMEEADESDESFSIGSFSSCSANFRKVVDRRSSGAGSSSSCSTPHEVTQNDMLIGVSCGVQALDGSDVSDQVSSIKQKRNEDANDGDEEDDEEDERPMSKMLATPESSSQNESDVSPQIQRKKAYLGRTNLPKFSISIEDNDSITPISACVGHAAEISRDLFPERNIKKDKPKKQSLNLIEMQQKQQQLQVQNQQLHVRQQSSPSSLTMVTPVKHKSRSSIPKSASATGLSLFIPTTDGNVVSAQSIQSPGGGSSTASSRDTSPCQELSPLISSLKPPIVIRRGPSGFGFTVHTVRVYYGDTYFYTMHHLVMDVDVGSPAFEAGLRPGDLITHINGEIVQGLYHTQVLQLLLSGGDRVTLRATPLENTSIRNDGKKRQPGQSKLASRKAAIHQKHKKAHRKEVTPPGETRKKSTKPSILVRINNNGTSNNNVAIKRPSKSEMKISSGPSFTQITPYTRSLSVQEPMTQDLISLSLNSPLIRVPVLSPDIPATPESNSSSSSSSNSPSMTPSSSTNSCYQRPSSLHGLKHKLATGTKNLHSPNRRKSIGHIPLSPLARTPSPSPLPSSPTRSPSPLIFPPGHHPGSSNTTQSYSPSVISSVATAVTSSPVVASSSVLSPSSSPPSSSASVIGVSTPNSKKQFGRAKNSSEARSPLFRRALSPDRLHPRNVEVKNNFISPLCDPALKVTLHAPRITVTSKSPPQNFKNTTTSVCRTSETLTMVSTYASSLGTLTQIPVIKSESASECDAADNCGADNFEIKKVMEAPKCELPHIIEEKESGAESSTNEGKVLAKIVASTSTLALSSSITAPSVPSSSSFNSSKK